MKYKILTLSALLISAGTLSAQTADAAAGSESGAGLSTILIGVNAVLLLFVIFLLGTLTSAVQKLKAGSENKVQLSWWDKFAALKSEKTEEELRMDEDFDGITELDNPTPPWFNFIFYTTILVAILYLLNYHILKIGSLQTQEYTTEVTDAKAKVDEYLKKSGNAIDENNVALLTDAKALEDGKQIFMTNCKVCHREDAGGMVGPNLTDEYWLHGGDIKCVFKTIKYGVPAKGMTPWQNALNGKQIQSVASYIKSLKGTNPPQPKEPQGTLYAEEGAAAPADSAAAVKTDTAVVAAK